MIKIDRHNFPPKDVYINVKNVGKHRWRCLENKVLIDFNNHPEKFRDGTYVFPKHPSYDIWREELLTKQGHKCCYCEKSIDKGELEHFRPKNGYKQQKGSSLTYPGYYWLAYRWKNLLLSCGECNDSARKGNLFPIGGIRAQNQRSSLNAELNHLINPYEETPNDSISFYKYSPISKNGRGRLTIDVFELDKRIDLKTERERAFATYESLSLLIKHKHLLPDNIQDKIAEAEERIKIAMKKKSPFSGMIRENVEKGLL